MGLKLMDKFKRKNKKKVGSESPFLEVEHKDVDDKPQKKVEPKVVEVKDATPPKDTTKPKESKEEPINLKAAPESKNELKVLKSERNKESSRASRASRASRTPRPSRYSSRVVEQPKPTVSGQARPVKKSSAPVKLSDEFRIASDSGDIVLSK
jgi:hypothetical protein